MLVAAYLTAGNKTRSSAGKRRGVGDRFEELSLAVAAAGGFYEVDRDQLAFIHKKEMVLPAGIADRLRTTVAGGGGSDSGMNINVFHNVNAIDAASFQDTIKKHGNMIGNEVARVLKKRKSTL